MGCAASSSDTASVHASSGTPAVRRVVVEDSNAAVVDDVNDDLIAARDALDAEVLEETADGGDAAVDALDELVGADNGEVAAEGNEMSVEDYVDQVTDEIIAEGTEDAAQPDGEPGFDAEADAAAAAGDEGA